MDEGGTFLHGLFRIEDGGKDFIFDLDEIEGFLGDIRVDGSDGSNLVPVGADFSCLEGDIVFIKTKFDGRNIVARQNSLHPGKFFGLGGIDAYDLCMGMGAVEDLPIEASPGPSGRGYRSPSP